jgi:hypothetical protein
VKQLKVSALAAFEHDCWKLWNRERETQINFLIQRKGSTMDKNLKQKSK